MPFHTSFHLSETLGTRDFSDSLRCAGDDVLCVSLMCVSIWWLWLFSAFTFDSLESSYKLLQRSGCVNSPSQQTFWHVIAWRAQMYLMTLMKAAFHSEETLVLWLLAHLKDLRQHFFGSPAFANVLFLLWQFKMSAVKGLGATHKEVKGEENDKLTS